jgi:hypothetical protein
MFMDVMAMAGRVRLPVSLDKCIRSQVMNERVQWVEVEEENSGSGGVLSKTSGPTINGNNNFGATAVSSQSSSSDNNNNNSSVMAELSTPLAKSQEARRRRKTTSERSESPPSANIAISDADVMVLRGGARVARKSS